MPHPLIALVFSCYITKNNTKKRLSLCSFWPVKSLHSYNKTPDQISYLALEVCCIKQTPGTELGYDQSSAQTLNSLSVFKSYPG